MEYLKLGFGGSQEGKKSAKVVRDAELGNIRGWMGSFVLKFLLKLAKLLAEASVGLAARPSFLYQLEAIIKAPAVLLQHVGDEYGRASRNSSSAMHQHIPPALPRALDPLVGRAEGVGGVLALAVVEVELEVHDVLGIGEVQVDA